MTKEEILSGLKEVIGAVKPKLDVSGVGMDTQLASELGIDSLSMLLMSLAIETKFNFQFKTQTPFRTVGEVVDYISESIA
ncbi:MAG: hypothetical protein KBT00_05910 [Bacteroidales bacterium]|nr:hypothetical protein [Candidatus Cacconaster merdequi]